MVLDTPLKQTLKERIQALLTALQKKFPTLVVDLNLRSGVDNEDLEAVFATVTLKDRENGGFYHWKDVRPIEQQIREWASVEDPSHFHYVSYQLESDRYKHPKRRQARLR